MHEASHFRHSKLQCIEHYHNESLFLDVDHLVQIENMVLIWQDMYSMEKRTPVDHKFDIIIQIKKYSIFIFIFNTKVDSKRLIAFFYCFGKYYLSFMDLINFLSESTCPAKVLLNER